MVQNWSHVPFLVSFGKVVKGYGLDNLTQVVIGALRGATKMERFALNKSCYASGQMVLAPSRVQN